jgi:GNAT superfamily N-acetyltransferase
MTETGSLGVAERADVIVRELRECLITSWGSVGFFGPLSVRPELWDQGVASRLMEATVALFDRWGTAHAGLFTFAHSAKHLGLYRKFGFWPRFLTPVMAKPVTRPEQKPMRGERS